MPVSRDVAGRAALTEYNIVNIFCNFRAAYRAREAAESVPVSISYPGVVIIEPRGSAATSVHTFI